MSCAGYGIAGQETTFAKSPVMHESMLYAQQARVDWAGRLCEQLSVRELDASAERPAEAACPSVRHAQLRRGGSTFLQPIARDQR